MLPADYIALQYQGGAIFPTLPIEGGNGSYYYLTDLSGFRLKGKVGPYTHRIDAERVWARIRERVKAKLPAEPIVYEPAKNQHCHDLECIEAGTGRLTCGKGF